MRWTTRIAIALLAAVLLALTLYAYPSPSGFVTLFVRAAAIIGALALVAVLVAAGTKRRTGRLDLIVFLGTIGLVIASWGQLTAKIDADRLAGEIEEAGETEIFAVLSATETETGSLVREAFALRDDTNAEIDAMFAELWDESSLAVVTGPGAEDAEALSAVVDSTEAKLAEIETLRSDVEAATDAEIEAIQAIDTPLPDSARLTFVDAAIQEAEADRLAHLQRLDLIADRVEAVGDAAAVLRGNAGNFVYEPASETVVFREGGAMVTDASARYSVALTNIDLSLEAEQALLAKQRDEAARIAAALDLVEAASATP